MHDVAAETAVVGAGYVGIATAVGLAEQGREIILVEKDPSRLIALTDGRIPFHEPGLPEAYATQHAAGRITPSREIPLDGLDLIVICVGTPIDDVGFADVSHVAQAIDQAGPAAAAGASCVIRSTLPVGWAARLANRPAVVPERLFVAPEFLRQGSALEDIRTPTRVIVGTFGEHPDPDALALVTDALARPGTPLIVMRAEEASLVKNASNVFLALRLTFANEVAGLAADLGVDVGPVLEGIGLDPRIGHTYMQPSFGFGGSCLPKEVLNLSAAGSLPIKTLLGIGSDAIATDDKVRGIIEASHQRGMKTHACFDEMNAYESMPVYDLRQVREDLLDDSLCFRVHPYDRAWH